MTARILPRLTSAQYHADPCVTPSLSASCANVILSKSAYHAWLSHPRLGGVKRDATTEMEAGSLLHDFIFENGRGDNIVIVEADDFRTKAAKRARDDAREAGKVPVIAEEYAAAKALADDVRAQLIALGFDLSTGESEVSVEWTETTTDGVEVLCRGRMDHLWLERGLIMDLKTCQSAHPRAVASSVTAYGYDVQRAAYVSALHKLRPEFAGRVDDEGRNIDPFHFVFLERLPDASKQRAIVQPMQLDATFCQVGEQRWQRAVNTWARCLATNEWPGYTSPGMAMVIEAPVWLLREEGMR